jgi:hypothetical protein
MLKIYNKNFIKSYLNLYIDKTDKLDNFIENYSVIITNDNEKPLFSQTTRYNQFPKNKYIITQLKNPLYNKEKNVWLSKNSDSIKKKIKIILNKITKNNYDKLSVDFNNILNNINNISSIHEINNYICNKLTNDKEFHYIYIKLCKNIWYNNNIKYNIIDIVKKNNIYYWGYKGDNINYNKQYNSIELLKKNINTSINFRNIFINLIVNKLIQKDELFKEIKTIDNDDGIFKIKNKIFSYTLFLTKLYLDREIKEVDYNNYIYIYLKNDVLYNEDIEALYIILTNFKNVFSKSFSEIIKNKLDKLDKNNYDDRLLFFIEFINNSVVNINNKINYKNCLNIKPIKKENKENKENNEQVPNIDIEKIFNKYISDNYKLDKFLLLNSNIIPELIEVSIFDVFENNINLKKIINLISYLYIKRKIHRRQIIKQLYVILDDYTDICIDYPNMHCLFISFIELLSKSIRVNIINNKFVIKMIKSVNDKNHLIKIINEIKSVCKKITNSALNTINNYLENNNHNLKK